MFVANRRKHGTRDYNIHRLMKEDVMLMEDVQWQSAAWVRQAVWNNA